MGGITRQSSINAMKTWRLLGLENYNAAWRGLHKLCICAIRMDCEKSTSYIFNFNRQCVGRRYRSIVQQMETTKPMINKQVASTVINPVLAI